MTVFSVAEHSQEIEDLIEESKANLPTESQEEFTIESHLEGFIIENWEKLELGKKYNIYSEEGEKKGQYVTPIGRIDILAKSKDKKEWLVIELKKGRSGHEVVGQILKYIGWIKENECPNNGKVKGLIILGEKEEGITYALKATDNIGLMTYSVSFQLKSEKLK
jgi:restriction system protein